MGNEGRMRPVRRRTLRRAGSEHGAIALMAVGALIILCGFCGLALDLSRVYNRKMEMQNAADPAALAAAIELDGTSAGITRAVTKATATMVLPFPLGPAYNYGSEPMQWSDSAIEFGPSPDGPWFSRAAAAAKSEPNGLLYAKVDTGQLSAAYGQVETWFLGVVSSGMATAATAARAVAGPSAIAVSPLGLCVMRPEAKRNRGGELEEYGFRRGVGYDLMDLNVDPLATTGQSFLIHPFGGPGVGGTSASDFNTVAPFVCTGTLGIARVTGGDVTVSSPFPLAEQAQQLNSRFDSYTTTCNPQTAPPDRNVKPYTFNDGSVPWMATPPEKQGASLNTDVHRWTVVGPDPTPAGTLASQYGPLWSYARAVRYADPAPASGYVAYTATNTDWATLYNQGKPTVVSASYPPTTVPYLGTGTYAVHTLAPTHPGIRDRRVLNVALLACPVTGSHATVKGIGRFFMTVPANSPHLYAEFAGLVEEQTLRTRVKLYR